MEDYIDALLQYVAEKRLSTITCEYSACLAREESASEALERTLTDEQRKLFRAYEEARNATDSMSEDAYARQAFLLAREIFR